MNEAQARQLSEKQAEKDHADVTMMWTLFAFGCIASFVGGVMVGKFFI